MLLIVASCFAAAAPVRADEMLVLPYTCSIAAGRPVLSPAREGHLRIIGGREQRLFTACSPVNPDMCRSWMVHRFDVDCGGARVPWPAIAAAVAEQMDGRAWMQDGRLFVRMSRWWGTPQDDPCALEDAYGYGARWRSRRYRRPCDDRRYGAGPPSVEMPRGYAPKLGIPMQFVALPPGRMAGAAPEPPPPRSPLSNPSGDWAARTEVPAARPDVIPDDAGRAPRTGTAMPPPAPVAPAEPKAPVPERTAPAPQHAAPSPKATRAESPAREVKITPIKPAETPPATGPNDTSGTAAVPKIINRPTPPRERADHSAPSAPAGPVSSAPSKRVAAANPPLQAPPGKGAAASDGQPIAVNLLSAPNPAATGLIAAFAGITIVLLSAFAWARRQENARGLHAARHDIGGISLSGGGASSRMPAAVVRAEPRPAPTRAVPAPTWGDEIPTTRAEALRMLGAGPEAAAGALKKIVDGLRQTWHPDRAADEPDRRLRELRMKQINAAWDILSGRRQET